MVSSFWRAKLAFWWSMHDMQYSVFVLLLLWLLGFFIPYGVALQLIACVMIPICIAAGDAKIPFSHIVGMTIVCGAITAVLLIII